jgi:hypothetical protein
MNNEKLSYNPEEFDQEKSAQEAKLGWLALQGNGHKKALEHFKQALIFFPFNDYAKSGMVEALKANYWVYRIFLKYAFWMESKKAGVQWAVILGFYFGNRGLLFINDQYPAARIITTPLIILYLIFAITTWIIRPISNLFLRLNSYGKFVLSHDEITCSNLLGINLMLAIIAVVVYFISGNFLFAMIAFFFATMSIPLATMFSAPRHSRARLILSLYAFGMLVLGVLSIYTYLSGGDVMNKYADIYMWAFVIYQWVANAMFIG